MKRKKRCNPEEGNDMVKENLKKLNLDKLREKKSIIVSSEKALDDVKPINWSKDVLSGKKKVTIKQDKKN